MRDFPQKWPETTSNNQHRIWLPFFFWRTWWNSWSPSWVVTSNVYILQAMIRLAHQWFGLFWFGWWSFVEDLCTTRWMGTIFDDFWLFDTTWSSMTRYWHGHEVLMTNFTTKHGRFCCPKSSWRVLMWYAGRFEHHHDMKLPHSVSLQRLVTGIYLHTFSGTPACNHQFGQFRPYRSADRSRCSTGRLSWKMVRREEKMSEPLAHVEFWK